MSQGAPDQDYLAVTTPTTPAVELQRIAATRPDLHLLILAHPNVYSDLVVWIQGQLPLTQPPDGTVIVEQSGLMSATPTTPTGNPSFDPETIPGPEIPGPALPDPEMDSAEPLGPPQAAPADQGIPTPPSGPIPQPALAEPIPAPQPAPASQPMSTSQPASTSQTQAPVASESKVVKQFPAWAAALIGVAVVVVGAVAAWFFLGDRDEAGPNAYNVLPTEGVVVDVSTFGRDVTLVPIGPEKKAALQIDSTRVVGFYGEHGPGIAGIDLTSGNALPQWIIPLGHAPSACSVSEETITCGDGDVYKVSGALVEPVGPSEASSGGTTESQQTEEASAKPTSSTVKLEGTASEEVPYGIAGTSIVNQQGEELLTVDAKDAFYGLPPDRKGEPWIISDGHVLIALSGNDELWSLELPEGSLEANGFGLEEGPSWSVASSVLLVGEPEGISAFETTTGEQLWRIDAEVASWRVDHSDLLVSNGSSVAFMEFPKEEAKAEGVTQSGADEVLIGEEQVEPAQTPLEDLLDATLEVPEECARATGLSNPATFSGGRAAGNSGSVSMTDVSSLLVGGELLDAIAFTCQPATGEASPAVAVYSQSLELWGVPDFLKDVSASAQEVAIEGMLGEGSALQVLLSGPGSLCENCGSSGSGQVTMLWDGGVFVTTHIGEPSGIWTDPTNAEKVQVGPQLTPEDLANITLYLPTRIWDPGPDWEEFTFVDYKSAWQTQFGVDELGIFDEQTVEAQVNGKDYLFTSIIKSTDGGGGTILGGICAISMEAEATCANNPLFGTSFVWVDNIRVDGDLVTYTLVNGDTNGTATVSQRFNGNSFTLVSSTV